ncbi:2OG-Fe(II) oxygenase [Streptomyces sp. DH18]|uniref:2OG-Fe(II) oxygenase n=1 Tax=Streptomyces sp. DH18 TaxID=3040126 RepID=UPI0024413D6D|nr:2OG-Fe(II) oxygenase [Streptomyces sp. DH18]MDG9681330.1 2OG-Fe(II) oxygenase [Streptomyces sp. DH18]
MNQSVSQPLPLFDDDSQTDEVPRAAFSSELPALHGLDWTAVSAQLNEDGVAVTPPLLSREQCQEIIGTYEDPALFRSTVVMQRHQFGRGTYKYYADPAAVPLVRALREQLYPPLAWMANQWAQQLDERTFPGTLDELIAECADNGQTRPTPLILRYGKGDYACLHQDVYGDIVFPLQITVMLNQPGEDFTGGENVFVEQRPRSQSRAMVVKPRLGQAMIFPVRHRPVRGEYGFRRHPMRHGTNAVESGRRNTLGVIFHNAR